MEAVFIFKFLDKPKAYSFKDLNRLIYFILNKDTYYSGINEVYIEY